MKMSWGYKILFVYLAFVAMIGFMVYKTTQQDIGLIGEDYYDQEIKFQEQIDMKKNSNALKQDVIFSVTNDNLVFTFPQEMQPSTITGIIHFIKPDNSKLDLTIPVSVNNQHVQTIEKLKLKQGKWSAKLTWSYGGKNYFSEFPIMLSQ